MYSIYIYIHMYIYIYILYLYIHIYIYIHMYIHIISLSLYIYIYIYIYTHTHICIHICIYIYIYIYTYFIYMYISTLDHTFVAAVRVSTTWMGSHAIRVLCAPAIHSELLRGGVEAQVMTLNKHIGSGKDWSGALPRRGAAANCNVIWHDTILTLLYCTIRYDTILYYTILLAQKARDKVLSAGALVCSAMPLFRRLFVVVGWGWGGIAVPPRGSEKKDPTWKIPSVILRQHDKHK